ncbi:MAG: cysteine desulfurase [Anaerolineaceae bacterium]|nr:cysteine desulfurase [Anaerolineaceae bacterium]
MMSRPILSARADFPILHERINDHPLVYLDNAATTQKPEAVLAAMDDYYRHYNANIHRSNHALAARATQAHEEARAVVARFLNAQNARQVIFTRGTTESINLVAYSFGEAFVHAGDEVITTQLEHHSNYVPWELLCQRKGARFKVLPFDENGELNLEVFKQMLSERTRIVALNQVSNSLGTVNPLEEIICIAHQAGVPVLVDGAQGVQHLEHDMQKMDCDFYAFSSHKMYGPMGIGVLYGKENWLEAMPPFLSGGEMIDTVSATKVTFNELPFKFEAGTPYVVGPIGLAAAIHYLEQFNLDELQTYEESLLQYGLEQLSDIPGVVVYGKPKHRSSIMPFNIEGVGAYDVGVLLDTQGIAVRTGQHCTQPIMDALNIPGTVRASLAIYNNQQEIDALIHGIRRVLKILKR